MKEMLFVLDKLAVPVRLMLPLGADGPNVNKSINAQDKLGQERDRLSTIGAGAHPAPNSHVTTVFPRGWLSMDTNAEELCLNLYYFFKRSSCR